MQRNKIKKKVEKLATLYGRSQLAECIDKVAEIKETVNKVYTENANETNLKENILRDLENAAFNITLLSTSDGFESPIRTKEIMTLIE